MAQHSYDPLSRVGSTSFLDASSVAYGYENDDDISTITHTYSGGSLALSYLHNGAHQIRSMTISDSSFMNEDLHPTQAYCNAARQRLAQGQAVTVPPVRDGLGCIADSGRGRSTRDTGLTEILARK